MIGGSCINVAWPARTSSWPSVSPNTEELDLAAAGFETNGQGYITENARLETSPWARL